MCVVRFVNQEVIDYVVEGEKDGSKAGGSYTHFISGPNWNYS